MAHGTYNNPRAGSKGSALRMQKMVNELNSSPQENRKIFTKKSGLNEKSIGHGYSGVKDGGYFLAKKKFLKKPKEKSISEKKYLRIKKRWEKKGYI